MYMSVYICTWMCVVYLYMYMNVCLCFTVKKYRHEHELEDVCDGEMIVACALVDTVAECI